MTDYDANYFVRGKYASDPVRGTMYELEVREMLKIVGFFGRFLDVGCAMGRFLQYLPDTFKKHGLEISDYAIEQARSRYDYTFHVGPLCRLDMPDESFDIIHFRGSFEHMLHTEQLLSKCYRLLAPGGWLILGTIPNEGGVSARLYGKRFRLADPLHIRQFTARSLKKYAREAGFSIHCTLYPYFGTPYANPLHDLGAFFVNYFTGKKSPPFFHNVMTVYAQKR